MRTFLRAAIASTLAAALAAGATFAQPSAGARSEGLRGPGLAAARADGMVLIPAGRFTMGSTAQDAAHDKVAAPIAEVERPAHTVTIGSFLLARRDVTRGEFARFVAETGYAPSPGCQVWYGVNSTKRPAASWRNPGFDQTDRDPVVCVNREDIDGYIRWLSRKTGRAWRLPSEAEWEYAARAGTAGSRYWGDALARQCAYANGASRTYSGAFPEPSDYLKDFPASSDVNRACADAHVFTSPVGSFRPNPWGLYDMLGNVWQWTADCRTGGYAGAPADGSPWTEPGCSGAVWRGGAWYDGPWLLRYAIAKNARLTARDNGAGFRLARSLP